jgi:hypothetical protein
MERRLGIALIASMLVAVLPPARISAQLCDPTQIDFVNIGDPVSELRHNLYGWGPIEPARSGGTWGGAGEDGNCRAISSGYDDGSGMNNFLDWAEFTVDLGDSPGTKCLQLRHLDGYALDSFYVYIDTLGIPGDKTEVFYWPDGQSQDEIWHTAQIPLDLTGVHTITLLSDQKHWPGWETYGQTAFTWAAVVPECAISEEEPTAITLASFVAEPGVGSVALAWETGTEVDNAGFNLYRASTPDGPYTRITGSLIASEGDPVAGASYFFLDEDLAPGTYTYELEDVDLNGVATRHGPVSATVSPGLRRPPYRPTSPD